MEAQCLGILDELIKHPRSAPFRRPFDYRGLDLMDYPEIVTCPMDLGTIRVKVVNKQYRNKRSSSGFDLFRFSSDVKLVFRNATLYYSKGTDVYESSVLLAKLFKRRLATMKNPASLQDADDDAYDSDDSYIPPSSFARHSNSSGLSSSSGGSGGGFSSSFRRLGSFFGLSQSSVDGQSHRASNKPQRQISKFSKPKTSALNRFGASLAAKRERRRSVKPLTPDQVVERFDRQETIPGEDAMALLIRATQLMEAEPNILALSTSHSSIAVIGDLHGQYFDLRSLLRKSFPKRNMPTVEFPEHPSTHIFLGDYVDRGDFSCEVLLLLVALKVQYPKHVHLLRGNHECNTVASYFGFKKECDRKYGRQVYHQCLSLFQSMPIGAVVSTDGGKLLCCHGGISPNIRSLEQLQGINRFREPGVSGVLCDLLWADPVRDDDMLTFKSKKEQEKEKEVFRNIEYFKNNTRGCSYRYGFKAVEQFLDNNKLAGMVRAHEVQEEGFQYHFRAIQRKRSKWNRVVLTVFSAPNYCGRYRNKGAYVVLKQAIGRKMKIQSVMFTVQYVASPHPTPAEVDDKTDQLFNEISSNCPYMPSTLSTFIRRAQAIGTEYGDAVTREQMSKNPPSPGPGQLASAKTLSESSLAEAQHKFKRAAFKISVLNAIRTFRISTFENALASDSMNEMHPVVVTDRLETASSRMTLAASNTTAKRGANNNTPAKREKLYHTPSEAVMSAFDGMLSNNAAEERPRTGSDLDRQILATASSGHLFGELAEWITGVLGIPFPGERDEFVGQLRDGTVLCKLVVKIAESMQATDLSMAIHEHNEKPLDKFQIQENFLELEQACARLGIKYVVNDLGSVRDGTLVMCLVNIAKVYAQQERTERTANPKLGDASNNRTSSKLLLDYIHNSSLATIVPPTVEEWMEESEIDFSNAELLTLELLFLLVDRDGDGKITTGELMMWSREDLHPIGAAEADKCIRAVDADGDGVIGHEDFLKFAAHLKELYVDATSRSESTSTDRD